MSIDLSVTFTGIRFENPFLLSSAPPTESESNILRAFEAGWGGVVTKTIGLHPVVNVAGPKTKFLRADPETGAALDEQGPRAARCTRRGTGSSSPTSRSTGGCRASAAIKKAFPHRVLIASIMAGSGSDKELDHWRTLARACQDAGRRRPRAEPLLPAHGPRGHGLEHRQGPGALLVRDPGREGGGDACPVWAKLTPATSDIVARGRRGLPRRRRRRRLVEHLPVAAPHRPRDASSSR